MTAWDDIDLAVVREAAADPLNRQVRLTLGQNLLGGQALLYVETIDVHAPRRRPTKVFPGPLVADSHADLLRALADVLDGTIGSLVVTDPRDLQTPRRCRECGCTDDDCAACIERTGHPCAWVEPAGVIDNLCTACIP
jgi:hypothetical protein